MRTGRPKAELVLSEEERAALERYARRGTMAQQLGLRAGISAVWPLLSLALMSAPLSSSAHTVGASPRDAALIESKVGDCDTQCATRFILRTISPSRLTESATIASHRNSCRERNSQSHSGIFTLVRSRRCAKASCQCHTSRPKGVRRIVNSTSTVYREDA